VGTAISNAPVLNFSMDIVEVEGVPLAKRGKLSGRKKVLRCRSCGRSVVVPAALPDPACCGEAMASLLVPLVIQGSPVQPLPDVHTIRREVLAGLERVTL
jgi:nicotinate phosphoribosyltransferase